MPDFAELRRRMVDNQIRTADVTHRPLLAAIEDVPRELFVPEAAKPFAYSDQHLLVGRIEARSESRYALAPVLVARMMQAVEPVQSAKVLHVACGTGYASAIFAKLGASVVALDEEAVLVGAAERALTDAGAQGVGSLVGMLTEGAATEAPFDVIFIEGSYQEEPRALLDQLTEGGRLIGVSGVGRAAQVMLQVKTGGVVTGRAVFDASAPLLHAFARKAAFAF